MSAPPDDEGGPREDRPTDETHANGFASQSVFHALAPVVGVGDARRLTARLQILTANQIESLAARPDVHDGRGLR